jgi:hypothetical protein
MKIEVGQVWSTHRGLVMVSSDSFGKVVRVGKAEARGNTYAIVGTPSPMRNAKLRCGTFVLDTESA